MPTTSNFGWTTPADTDLVKDGAAAIRTLGNGIDTSLVDLKGGTTGQILSKASNADLDYTWINNDQGDITEVAAGTGISGGGTSGSVTITNSMATAIDAKGDLIVGTADNAFSRLASSGVNNQILTVDTSTATGLKWAAAATTSGPAFQATLTNAQTLNQSTTTTVAFDAENFDTASCFNTTNYRFTPNQAGYYWIYGQLFLAQGNAARMIVTIDKNGSEYCRLFDLNTSPNVEWYFNGGITMYLNGTTDYVTMSAWLGGTATRQVVNTSTNNRTRFEGYFIRS